MIRAYNSLYVSDAQKTLGYMIKYLVLDCKLNIDKAMDLFIDTGYAWLFEHGDPSVLVGHSGCELGMIILEKAGYKENFTPSPCYDRPKEYWSGWALAYFQWYTSLSFKEILSKVTMSDILNLYYLFHEMDILSFCAEMSKLIVSKTKISRLKERRQKCNITQQKLALDSGVSKRMIEQYEEGKRSLRKASAETVISLSKALYCSPEDIFEIEIEKYE